LLGVSSHGSFDRGLSTVRDKRPETERAKEEAWPKEEEWANGVE